MTKPSDYSPVIVNANVRRHFVEFAKATLQLCARVVASKLERAMGGRLWIDAESGGSGSGAAADGVSQSLSLSPDIPRNARLHMTVTYPDPVG